LKIELFGPMFLVTLLCMAGSLGFTKASDHESADLKQKFEPWLWNKLQTLEIESPDGYISLIIRSPSHAEKAQLVEILKKSVDAKNMDVLKALPVVIARVKASSVRTLASNPLIEHIGDGERKFVACADVATEVIGARRSWETYGLNGSGKTIAILDTGINATHPDLDDLDDDPNTTDPKVIANVSYVGYPENITEGPEDLYGHGAWCAGLASGTGYASNGTYKGAAPGAQLVNVKVLNRNGVGNASWIVAGLEWVIQHKDEYNITVVSMSLGAVHYSPKECLGDCEMCRAVNEAVNAGLVVCAAQGNVGPEATDAHEGKYPCYTFDTLVCVRPPGCPGVSSKAITVGGYDDKNTPNFTDDTMWIEQVNQTTVPPICYDVIMSRAGPTNYTNTNWTKPDVVAPAASITSCNAGWETDSVPPGAWKKESKWYITGSGTSAATPLVAGAAALVTQKHPDWTPAAVKEALKSTALLTGDLASGYNNYTFGPENIRGKGLVNVTAAMALQAPTTPSTPSGLTSGTVGVSYIYSTSAEDPDGDLVRYRFSWGDGMYWLTEWCESGATVNASHAWSTPGTYNITVRAQDCLGLWSDWSSNLTVSIAPLPLVNLVVGAPQAPPEGVNVWVDGNTYTAYADIPVSIFIESGQHAIEAQQGFLKEGWESGVYYSYTFHSWSDGSQDNPRTITLYLNTSLTAWYVRTGEGNDNKEPG